MIILTTNTIFVGLSNLEKYKMSLAKLFGEKPDETSRFVSSTIKYIDQEVEIVEHENRRLINRSSGRFFAEHKIEIEKRSS